MQAKSSVSNDADYLIVAPFSVNITICGTADLLFHRWSDDEVEARAKAAKGSKAKKTDNPEVYVYRDQNNYICMPGRYIQRAIVEAARFHQDPRSPRKMAKDLVQAAVVASPVLSPILVDGKPVEEWDYLDRQRVVIQRAAITRTRPAFYAGWQVEFSITSLLPEYVTPEFLRRLVSDAGRFVGLADFRPTYGRYDLVIWEEVKE
jgi:hypothetical protein